MMLLYNSDRMILLIEAFSSTIEVCVVYEALIVTSQSLVTGLTLVGYSRV